MSEPLFERVLHEFAGVFHQPHYHHNQHKQYQSPKETPVSILTAIKADVEKAKELIDGALPKIGGAAESLDNSPLFQEVLGMIDDLDPALEATMVTVLRALAGKAPAPVPVPEPAPATA